jgi:hypothetical protein
MVYLAFQVVWRGHSRSEELEKKLGGELNTYSKIPDHPPNVTYFKASNLWDL